MELLPLHITLANRARLTVAGIAYMLHDDLVGIFVVFAARLVEAIRVRLQHAGGPVGAVSGGVGAVADTGEEGDTVGE